MKKMLLGMAIELFAIALALCSRGYDNVVFILAVVGLVVVWLGYKE